MSWLEAISKKSNLPFSRDSIRRMLIALGSFYLLANAWTIQLFRERVTILRHAQRIQMISPAIEIIVDNDFEINQISSIARKAISRSICIGIIYSHLANILFARISKSPRLSLSSIVIWLSRAIKKLDLSPPTTKSCR